MCLLTLPPRWEASKEHMPFGVHDMASFLPVVGDIFQRELAKQLLTFTRKFAISQDHTPGVLERSGGLSSCPCGQPGCRRSTQESNGKPSATLRGV